MKYLKKVDPTPEQLKIIEGPVYGITIVRGAAGSGKTTSAALRLRKVIAGVAADRLRTGDASPIRALVLTFNRTLKGYVEKLARAEVKAAEVEVDLTVDTFAGWANLIVGGPQVIKPATRTDVLRAYWSKYATPAINGTFVAAEVDYVLGRFGREGLDDYLLKERVGRGAPTLPRATRQKGGGNGAAMRIQPHVWVAARRSDDWRRAVVENVLTTHGHPNALAGALFHAELLRATALSGGPVTTAEAADIVRVIRAATGIIEEHPKLGPPWLLGWQRESGKAFDVDLNSACGDLWEGLVAIDGALKRSDRDAAYHALLAASGALTQAQQGSGTKTALAAYAATLLFSGRPPTEMICAVSEELGSDTDSIATMAGALVGIYAREEPKIVLDRSYIVNEAMRLAKIALGAPGAGEFPYRRNGEIRVPKDGRVLHEHEGTTYVAGLGRAEPSREPARKGSNGELYRWYHLEFGQSMLFHVPPGRAEEAAERTVPRRVDAKPSLFDEQRTEREQPSQRGGRPPTAPESARTRRSIVLEDPREAAMRLVRESIDDPARIGRFFLARARYEGNESWIGAVFYELARLYRTGVRNAAASVNTEERASEQPRPAYPVLNLQLTASRAEDGSAVDGIIGNHGRNVATDVAIRLSGNGSDPDLTYNALQVQERSDVAARISRTIEEGTTVIVTFRAPDGTQLRQEGRFQRAPGHETTFLLKGLGVARPITA